MITVNYFDLGLHTGLEIVEFLKNTDGLPDADVCVHGIEANPQLAEYCRKQFALDSRVHIHNFAIGLEDGYAELYLTPNDGLGSSIYSDKPNVTQKCVRVPQHRMSTWLGGMGFLPKPARTINIIKANIEGAEWDLMRDLDQQQLFGFFDLFCGPKHNQGWMTDMRKVPSLQSHVDGAKSILDKNGVQVHKYIVSPMGESIANVIDMRKAISKLLQEVANGI